MEKYVWLLTDNGPTDNVVQMSDEEVIDRAKQRANNEVSRIHHVPESLWKEYCGKKVELGNLYRLLTLQPHAKLEIGFTGGSSPQEP